MIDIASASKPGLGAVRTMLRARRPIAVLAAAGVAAAMGAVAVGAALPSPAVAATVDHTCPPGTLPPPNNSNIDAWTDNGVAVYAGKDLHVTAGAAEVEGLLVTGRNALIDKQGLVNIGSVGVGSGTPPSGGSTMFAVGGDLTLGAGARIEVGFGVTDGNGTVVGGDVAVGGATSPLYVDPDPAGTDHDVPPYAMDGGTLTQNLGSAATQPWSGWNTTLTQQSAAFSALPDTGTVTATGNTLVFASTDATADPQVFTVSGATLASTTEVAFNGIPASTRSVIVNVTGTAPVDWKPTSFFVDGTLANDFSSGSLFGQVAQRTMWNFADSSDVTIGGSSQVLGSILVPHINPADGAATLTVTASTNGRVMTNGSLLMDGQGNELHNYPWNMGPFSCVDEPGAFVIDKSVDGAGAPEGLLFTGSFSCTQGAQTVASGLWSARAGGNSGRIAVPAGSSCTVSENTPPQGADGTWGRPTITGSPATITAASSDTPLTVSIVNHWIPAGVPVGGSFTVMKVVRGADAPRLTFTGGWVCTLDGATVTSGTWAAAAGETAGPFPAPVGAACAVTEDTPAASPGGTWQTPQITGSPAIIAADAQAHVTVENTWTPETPTPTPTPTPSSAAPAGNAPGSSALASTGGQPAPWLAPLAIALLAAGAIIWVVGRRSKA